MGFRTSYIDEQGNEIFDKSAISEKYLKSTFFVDFFATVPIDVFVQTIFSSNVESLSFLGLLKLGRLLRINKIIQFLNTSRDFKAGAQLINLICFLVIYLHWYACILWFAVKDDQIWTPYYLQEDVPHAIKFLYHDPSVTVLSKYLVCLYQSVQGMGGGDFCPTNTVQIIFAAFGVFMAAYINANIFGELTMILEGIGKEEEEFQQKFFQCQNTMLNLLLPFSLCQDVRSQLKVFAPLELNQKQLIQMIDYMPPSIECKIIEYQYSKYLNQLSTYNGFNDFIEILTKRL